MPYDFVRSHPRIKIFLNSVDQATCSPGCVGAARRRHRLKPAFGKEL
ncbi:hypothetical protein [Nostoc sp. JL33]|nr:hypothetical protein [Nostoc sp. JL33]MBN3873914.1 hypothetical protein [Nostoc sp. JL33]